MMEVRWWDSAPCSGVKASQKSFMWKQLYSLIPRLVGVDLILHPLLKVGDFLQAALRIDVDSIAGVNFHKFFQRLILLILDGR